MINSQEVLIVANLQDPITGAVVANRTLRDHIILVPSVKLSVEELSLPSKKGLLYINYIKHYWKLFSRLRSSRCSHKIVYTASSSRMSLFRDYLLLPSNCKDLYLYYHNRGMEEYGLLWLKRLFRKKKYKLILLNESLKSEFRSITKLDTVIRILPNTVLEEKAISKHDASNQKITLLFLSNFIKDKGIEDFLSLLDGLCLNNFRVVVIGRDYDYTSEELLIRLKNSYQGLDILHVGEAFGAKKWNLLSKCDVLFFPSTYRLECFPLSILEGMMANLVVLSYDIGATKSMLGDTGRIVQNLSEAAEYLTYLSHHRDVLIAEQNRCRQRYFATYSNEAYHEKLLKIFTIG